MPRDVVQTVTGEVYDSRTGELVGVAGTFIPTEERLRRKQYFEKQNDLEDKTKSKLLDRIAKLEEDLRTAGVDLREIEEGGNYFANFIWAYFRSGSNLFPDLKTNDICRLAYLATYCEYGSNTVTRFGKPVEKEELRTLMNLNRATFNEWIDKITKLKYIKIDEGSIRINKKFINRGVINSADGSERSVRLFIDMVRELYRSLSPADHHKMGLVLRLAPYINPYFNCLAKNPNEKDIDKLVRMRLGELAEALGYSPSRCRTLGNELLSLRFGEEQKKVAVAVAVDSMSPKDMLLIFNPDLFFRGNKQNYEMSRRLFRLTDIQERNI